MTYGKFDTSQPLLKSEPSTVSHISVATQNRDSEIESISPIRVQGFESESKSESWQSESESESKSAKNKTRVGLESLTGLEYYITATFMWCRLLVNFFQKKVNERTRKAKPG